ncbi:MAG: WD40/YVTN/BNR-like repeat-containing protein [Dehalococcoidia bacterium]
MAKHNAARPRSAAAGAGSSRRAPHADGLARFGRWPWVAGAGALLVVAAATVGVIASRGGHATSSGIAVLHTPDYHSLAFSPTDPSVVFFGHHNGVMRSDDGGRSFHPLVSRTNFDAMNMAVNPANAQQVYLAGHGVFQMSTDGGASWQALNTNLPGTDIHGFAMNPDAPTHLTAFVVGFGLFASSDAGHTWQRLGARVPGDVMSVSSAGGSPETLYAASMAGGILRSTNGGQSFAPVAPTLGRTVYTLAVDPAAHTTVYAGADGGLFKSTDSGATWTKLPYPGDNAAVVGVSRALPGLILAIDLKGQDGVVERSDDGGMTWNTGRYAGAR